MAPTTLPGQKTTSSAQRARCGNRRVTRSARPKLLATLDGASYVVRRSLHDPKNIRMAKKAIRTAFEVQVRGLGFSMVELLSTCPTNWGMTPAGCHCIGWKRRWCPIIPLGDYKVNPAIAEIEVLERRTNMQTEIIIAGFGGQGVLLRRATAGIRRHG